jgi:hypothetical protein
MSKLIKRKQIDLKLKAAPDGSYGFSSNIPNVLQGDDLESAIDKIVAVLDKLAPAMPPLLNQLTLSLSVAGGTTSATTGLLTSDGTTKTNIHKFVNNSTLTWTTTGIFNSVTTRNGHFRDGDSTTAKLRVTHIYDSSTKQATISDINTIAIDGTDNAIDSTDYVVRVDITEKKDYYSDDAASATKSNFYKSIKGAILATMATTYNAADDLERSISIEYSENGTFTDTIGVTGTYRIESATAPTASINSVTIPAMSGQKVSGVPSLNNGQIISVDANISNGIKFYYPAIIASSTVTSASTLSTTLSGVQTANSTYNYLKNHTISGSVTVESVSTTVTPNDIFVSGSVASSTDSTKRIDTVGISKITTDASTRKLSPSTGGQYEAISGTAYGLSQHDNTLNPVSTDSYSYQLQVYGNNYRYPSGNFTTYSGPNYSSLTQNSWRYADFSLSSITNRTNIDLTIAGASGISGNPYGTSNFRLYVKVEGSTGWLDANAAWASGTPIADGDAAVDVGNSTSATVRRITFGATLSGSISIRVGINTGSSITFTGITIA